VEPPAPTPAPGEVELWVVAVELVLGTDAPPDVPLDVVVPGAVVAGVEVVVAAVDADVEDVVIGRERFAGGGAGEDELEVAASEPPPHAAHRRDRGHGEHAAAGAHGGAPHDSPLSASWRSPQ